MPQTTLFSTRRTSRSRMNVPCSGLSSLPKRSPNPTSLLTLVSRLRYQYFWFDTHHVEAFLKASANESHVAIGLLCTKFPDRIRCVTQNVDNLHRKGGCPDSSLVEIHGRLGIYRCANDNCPNATLNVVQPEQLAFMTTEEEAQYQSEVITKGEQSIHVSNTIQRIAALYREEAKKGTSKVEDFDLPCCALCRYPVLPLVRRPHLVTHIRKHSLTHSSHGRQSVRLISSSDADIIV